MWDNTDWENDNEDTRESNGLAFQRVRREHTLNELREIENKLSSGLSPEERAKLDRRASELKETIDYIDDLIDRNVEPEI